MSTRVEIVHRTGFRYDEPVNASYNEARITPMTTPTQQTLRGRVEVRPVSWEMSYLDYWGSQVTAFEVHQPHDQLEVTARSIVELDPLGLHVTSDAGVAGWADLTAPALVDEYVEMLQMTPRTEPTDGLAELVAGLRGTASPEQVARQVCDIVHEHVEYVPGSSEVRGTAAEAWAARKGVCQDIAHLAVGALRSLGIPARYVSGYFDPRQDPLPGQATTAESHAWVEWWAGDWTGFDPTNAVPPDERHVIVARGRDYTDVTPLKGIYSGSAQSQLFVEVQIRRLG
ncbi:MAG: transglutaminase family protein [Actinomycetota bacterium]|nr:transglutaminase family protein [Actinomycetota bacterium]